MEYFSNLPAPCPSERLPKPKEAEQTDQHKRKLSADEKGQSFQIGLSRIDALVFSDNSQTKIGHKGGVESSPSVFFILVLLQIKCHSNGQYSDRHSFLSLNPLPGSVWQLLMDG